MNIRKIKTAAEPEDHYGPLASEFYQLTKDVDGGYPDVPYYLEKLSDVEGRILEVGVGTGRLLIPLLANRIELEGMDSSASMLDLCAANLKARRLKAPLHRQDARTMKITGAKFAAIVISFGSFQIFAERADALQVLKTCASHLAPGGQLFVDLDIPRLELDRAGLRVYGTRVAADDGTQLMVEGSKTYSVVNQVESVQLRYERWSGRKLLATELQFLDLRWYGRYEFQALLSEAGFKLTNFCVDYDDTQTTPEDFHETLSFVARKK